MWYVVSLTSFMLENKFFKRKTKEEEGDTGLGCTKSREVDPGGFNSEPHPTLTPPPSAPKF